MDGADEPFLVDRFGLAQLVEFLLDLPVGLPGLVEFLLGQAVLFVRLPVGLFGPAVGLHPVGDELVQAFLQKAAPLAGGFHRRNQGGRGPGLVQGVGGRFLEGRGWRIEIQM